MMLKTVPKQVTTEESNPSSVGVINKNFDLTDERNDKAFSTIRAAYTLKGYSLYRTDPADGPMVYWAECWGLIRYLPILDSVCQILEQIGGRL